MSDTYLGWDGKPYPWPPPDGWYHASDGRWWAPGTGPNPPPVDTPTRRSTPPFPDATEPERPTEGEQARTLPVAENDPTAPFDPDPYAASEISSPAIAATAAAEDPDTSPTTPTGDPDDHDGSAESPSRPGSANRMILLGVVAIVVVVAGLAYALITAGDDETDATDQIGSDTESTTTTVATTTTTTLVTVDGVRQIGRFRSTLADNDLASENLTDDDILTFAESFCGLAQSSEDRAGFEEIRTGTIATSSSELDDDQLSLIIDTAIGLFCPDEAERLDLPTEDASN